MSLSLLLVIILIILLLGAVPVGPAPWAANWGWGPSGLLGIVLVVILIAYLLGHRF